MACYGLRPRQRWTQAFTSVAFFMHDTGTVPVASAPGAEARGMQLPDAADPALDTIRVVSRH